MTPGPAKQFDREEALCKALDLFWSQGYEKTGMKQLLDHMQIGRQSLYDTFGSKRELFIEALEQYQNTTLQPVLEILEAPGSPLGNLRQVFDLWVSMASEHRDKGCLLGRTTMSFASSDDDMSKILRRRFARLEAAFQRLFEEAIAQGELTDVADPLHLARMILNTTQGLALMGQLDDDPEFVGGVLDTLFVLLPRKS